MGYDTKHCVTTQIRSSRMTEDGKTGFSSFKDVFFLVSVVPVVSIALFRWFRWFRWFRFGRFGRFGGFVSAFRVLVHACFKICKYIAQEKIPVEVCSFCLIIGLLLHVMQTSIFNISCCFASGNESFNQRSYPNQQNHFFKLTNIT